MSATVISVTEIGNRGGSKASVFSAQERRLRYFSVVLDQPSPTADDDILSSVYSASPGPDTLPVKGASHPNWALLVVLSLTPVPEAGDGAATNWIVAVEYGTNIYQVQYPPWQWLDRRSSSVIEYQRVMTRDFSTVDANGLPLGVFLMNTAGDHFYPPAHMVLHNQLLTVTRARRAADFNPGLADKMIGTINAAAFTIRGTTYALETALMKSITWRDENYQDPSNPSTSYYEITFGIEITRQVEVKNLWLANTGFHALAVANNLATKYRITFPVKDNNGNLLGNQPVTVPQYLNADGTLRNVSPDNTSEIGFQRATTADWATNAGLS